MTTILLRKLSPVILLCVMKITQLSILTTKCALENLLLCLHIWNKRPVYCIILLSWLAPLLIWATLLVIISQQIGLVLPGLLLAVSNTTVEVLSSWLGTTTTDHSLVLPIAVIRMFFSRILILWLKMAAFPWCLPSGSIWLLRVPSPVCTISSPSIGCLILLILPRVSPPVLAQLSISLTVVSVVINAKLHRTEPLITKASWMNLDYHGKATKIADISLISHLVVIKLSINTLIMNLLLVIAKSSAMLQSGPFGMKTTTKTVSSITMGMMPIIHFLYKIEPQRIHILSHTLCTDYCI